MSQNAAKYVDLIPDPVVRASWASRYHAMVSRCTKANHPDYKNYGRRGIKVFEPWLADIRNFLTYIKTLKGWDNISLTMDRRENNGDYAPGNLRMVTYSVNLCNRRKYTRRWQKKPVSPAS